MISPESLTSRKNKNALPSNGSTENFDILSHKPVNPRDRVSNITPQNPRSPKFIYCTLKDRRDGTFLERVINLV